MKHYLKSHLILIPDICSPADVPGPRKVQLQDKDITTDIRQKFEELCEEYREAFARNNEDIGRTKLVKMDIDTGDSPPEVQDHTHCL